MSLPSFPLFAAPNGESTRLTVQIVSVNHRTLGAGLGAGSTAEVWTRSGPCRSAEGWGKLGPMRTRNILLAGVAFAAAPVAAMAPVSLEPLGATFAPESPAAVGADHPLYRGVSFEAVEDMPKRVGPFYAPITSAKEMNEAVRRTLDAAKLLAPAGAHPKATLKVRWVALDAPVKISFSSEATATLGYTLTAADGRLLLQRDIRTHTEAEGGVASERLRGNARLAIATNLASALVCLDRAGQGRDTGECTLTPTAEYRAPPPVILVPR